MKTYYLAAETSPDGKYDVFVTDNARGRTVLMNIEANSYSEAVKRVSFSARNMGKTAFCGVKPNGEPFHGEA